MTPDKFPGPHINAVIFAAALMVGISFVIALLTAMKKTLTMMMILMMLITTSSRRRVIEHRERLALVVRKSHFHFFV